MIDLTVKTLDSQNHSFSLEDDITVRGFKEQIAESVSVPADSQRLIYCGRVLQDEKKLNEYDVNGKVIHLVQRAPPQPGQRGNGSGQDQNQGQGQGRHHAHRPHYRHARAQVHLPRIDGNAMYLGAMSFPADVVEAQGLPVPLLSNTLSNSRLIVARRMLNRASQLINRLDDPTNVPSPNANDGGTSAPPQQDQTPPEQEQEPDDGVEGGAAAAAGGASGVGGAGGGGLAQAASAAVFAALSAAGLNNVVTLLGNRGNNEDGGEPAGTGNVNSDEQPEQPAQQQQQSEEQLRGQGPQQQETPTNTNGQHTRHTSPQVPRPPQMAELLERLLATQDRLRPYIDRYRVLMLADPSLPPGCGPEGVEENQRVVDGVSESLHYLSHAYHALSDIVVDMGQQPPRNLRCRPIIIQHSAVLQAGIPVQVEAHISLHGRISNNNNNGNGGPQAEPQPADASESAAPADVVNSDDNQQEPTVTDPQQQHQQPPPFGTVFNLPSNVEVLMEVSPESSMETAPRGEQNQSSSNNNNNNNSAGGISEGSGGVFSWGSAPPPDFIRNLMQAVTGQIVQGGVNTMPSGPNTAPATGGQQTAAAAAPDGTNPNPGQSTQARSNTGTHPTTSTQTRSTPRPHVFHSHSHPLGMGMGMGQGRDFDPFLPCNSHHVRRTPTVSPNAAGGQQQQTQANQTPTAESQSQTQSSYFYSASSTSSSPSSSADNANASNTAPPMPPPNAIPFVNLFSQLLGSAGSAPTVETQEGANASSNGANRGLGSLMQLFSGGSGIHVVQGLLSEGSSHPAGSMTLADLLEGSPGLGMGQPGSAQDNQPQRGESLLVDLTVTLAQNMTLEGLAGLRVGRWEPLASLRRPLREFFHNSFTQSSSSSSSSSEVQEEAAERLIVELQPHLHQLLSGLAKSGRVDVEATVENRLRTHILDILRLLLDEAEDDARFGQGMLASVRDLGAELCAILRYSLRGGQAGLESVALRLAVNLTEGVHPALRQWTLNSFVSHVRSYSQRVPQPPEAEIRRLLTFKDESNIAETVTQVPAQVLTSQPQPEPEPMETEVAEDTASSEAVETDEVVEEQGVFPGHEALPSDWVPIIARDGAKQRRQLEMQTMTGSGTAGFSDAYLGGMPSKRRKLIEQQKPRLLASPTPNHSSISISMERLVREGVSRAGVEEVEGAAASVATDPGVRRAFGQAIRDCLHPRRHMTPDFPDPLRFPNATKYFADPEHASK